MNTHLKISIITVCFNSEKTIQDTIISVLGQTYGNVEYIVVDGGSTDRTMDIVAEYSAEIKYVSGPDNGIYDAMNKGISISSGDYIGFLNADDFFANRDVISDLVRAVVETNTDVFFSQLDVVDEINTSHIVRKYRVSRYSINMLRLGMMPAHPTVYIRRSCYQLMGSSPYRTDYLIASDFELILRLLISQHVAYTYLPMVSVKMRAGGVSNSNLSARLQLNREVIRACKENGVYTNWLILMFKIPVRLWELIW